MDLQFYPTPKKLAYKAWTKFKNTHFVRILEPSAGQGDLIEGGRSFLKRWGDRVRIDAIEIDPANHPTLKERANIIGFDFFKLESAAAYGHILLNPPFAEGVKHVLHAWNILFDGEIVAILNAETIRNPFSKERQFLNRLIEQHGEVEFISNAFTGPDVTRQAEVEIALVRLHKKADTSEILGDLLGSLQKDPERGTADKVHIDEGFDIVLPNNVIQNAVLSFNVAVEAMRASVIAELRSMHYTARVGKTLAETIGQEGPKTKVLSVDWAREQFATREDNLKDRAWTWVLNSTQVRSKLSSKAQSRLEAGFDDVKKLAFTEANIYGFLEGLASAGNQIQMEMVCDIFDSITKYHTKNTVFYRGWKSNDRHRTCGMRIRTTRFIIPITPLTRYTDSIGYQSERMLADFDKVFALVDGKAAPGISLESLFRQRYRDLAAGERLTSSYFDVRLYLGAGTIHFFAKDKSLIDRFNRLVGHHRNWLPPAAEPVAKDFWLQYDQAEKFDAEIRTEFEQGHSEQPYWQRPKINTVFFGRGEDAVDAAKALDDAMRRVQEKKGIDIQAAVQQGPATKLLAA